MKDKRLQAFRFAFTHFLILNFAFLHKNATTMKKIPSIVKAVRRFFGIAKYRYYVIVLREKQSMPGEVPDTFVSGNIFFSKRAAKVYAKWLLKNTILYDKADIESFVTDTPHAYAELTYPRCEDEKMTITYVMPD